MSDQYGPHQKQVGRIHKKFNLLRIYKLINKISDVKLEANASDFFAMTEPAAKVLRENYREKVRFRGDTYRILGLTDAI